MKNERIYIDKFGFKYRIGLTGYEIKMSDSGIWSSIDLNYVLFPQEMKRDIILYLTLEID